MVSRNYHRWLKRQNFKAVAITAGFILSIAFPNSKLPPMAKSAKGVVIFAKLFTVLSSIGGNFIFNAEKITPITIPKIIGFVIFPLMFLLMFSPVLLPFQDTQQ